MRRALPLLLSATLGCTSTTTLGPGALAALARTTTNDTLQLPDKNGMVVEITPNATIEFPSSSLGPPEDVPASDIYSSAVGLHRSNGDLIMAWGDTRTVKVEQFDGAATVAVTATAAILIVVIAAFLKSAPSTPSSVPKAPSGSGHAPNVPTRSAPSAPTSGSGLDAEALARAAELTMELAANTTGTGPSGAIAIPLPPDPVSVDAPPPVLVPLFSSSARRRANIRAIARLDGGACWPGEGADCVVAGARVGVRLIDFFEFAFGVRTETSSAGTRGLAIGSAMLHGEVPAAHWFALALGASIAFDGVREEVIPAASVRFRPVRGLWLGVAPVAPIYATDTGKWVMSSNVEITGEL